MTRSTALPFLLLAIPQAVTALEVSPSSPCSTQCLDSPSGNEWEATASNTFAEDISCRDDEYYLSAKGKKFRQCVECLQTSTARHEQETDLEWFIYNLRYAVSTCVFSKPNPVVLGKYEPPCNTESTCGLLNHALTGDGPSPNATTAWDYCAAGDGEFLGTQLQPCISCLRNSKDQTYLANFMNALKAGCMQGPDVATLDLEGELFTTDPVDIADRDVSDESTNPPKGHRHLAVAAVVGIGVGVVLIFCLAILLLLIYHIQQNTSCNPEHFCPHGDMTGAQKTPWHQSFSRSRRLGCRSKKAPKEEEFSPHAETNGDYYNRMEEATDSGRLKFVHDPRLANRGPDNAMLTHQAYKVNTQISRTDASGISPRIPPSIAPSRKQQYQAPDDYIEQAYRDSVQEALRISKPESTYARSLPASSSPRSLPSRSPPMPTSRSPPVSTSRSSHMLIPQSPPMSTARSSPMFSSQSPPMSTSRSSPMFTSRSTSGLESSSPEILSSPTKSPKSRKARKYIPSILKLRPSSTDEKSGDHQLRISPPIMQYDARFDESLSPQSTPQGVEMVQQRLDGDEAARRKDTRKKLYIEVPIENTENDLF